MDVLFREAKFKLFFVALGVPFVLMGAFAFVFMGMGLGFNIPPPYLSLIFPIVGCVVISFDVKAWARYFRAKRIIRTGADGTAVYLSRFRSDYYIKRSYRVTSSRRLNYYGIEFSFKNERGETVKKKTPAFLHPNEAEALRLLNNFKIKRYGNTAVIVQDLTQAIADLSLQELTHLE